MRKFSLNSKKNIRINKRTFISLSYLVLWHKLNIERDILNRMEQQMEHFKNK